MLKSTSARRSRGTIPQPTSSGRPSDGERNLPQPFLPPCNGRLIPPPNGPLHLGREWIALIHVPFPVAVLADRTGAAPVRMCIPPLFVDQNGQDPEAEMINGTVSVEIALEYSDQYSSLSSSALLFGTHRLASSLDRSRTGHCAGRCVSPAPRVSRHFASANASNMFERCKAKPHAFLLSVSHISRPLGVPCFCFLSIKSTKRPCTRSKHRTQHWPEPSVLHAARSVASPPGAPNALYWLW